MISKGMLAIFLVAAVLISGCTTTGSVNTTSNNTVKEFSIQSGHVMEDGKSVPRFSPTELTVNKGDRVRVSITNTKGTHDFKIDEFSVFSETPVGETVTVEFTADKAGDFIYYCSKYNHRAQGQWGTLKVIG